MRRKNRKNNNVKIKTMNKICNNFPQNCSQLLSFFPSSFLCFLYFMLLLVLIEQRKIKQKKKKYLHNYFYIMKNVEIYMKKKKGMKD